MLYWRLEEFPPRIPEWVIWCQSWGPTGGTSPAVLLCLAIHTPRLKHYSFPKRSMIGQPPSPPSQIHKGNNHIQKSVRPTVLYLAAQSCLTLCSPMDYSPPGFSVHRDSPGKNTGVGCHALLQGIFPNQGSNPGFPRWRWILYCLSHQGDPGTPPNKPQMLSRQYIIHQSFHLIFHEHLWSTLLSTRGTVVSKANFMKPPSTIGDRFYFF